MSPRWTARLLRTSAVAALVALGLILWPLFDPSPLVVVVAMSIGQAIGTLSFALFLIVVFFDLRRAGVLRGFRRVSRPPPESTEREDRER
jgi:hypothetical protein